MIKDRILIFDALNVFMRHYIAHPAMSDNGEQIGCLLYTSDAADEKGL